MTVVERYCLSEFARPTDASDAARHVLIVDDDASSLSALKRLLELWGWTATACSTFEQARAALASDGAPDALVVDVRLGEYNGLQLILLAKQQHPNLRVVAISGFEDPVLRAEAARIGARYLTKPVDLQELQELLQSPARVAHNPTP